MASTITTPNGVQHIPPQASAGPTVPDPTGAPDGQVVTTASGALVLATPAAPSGTGIVSVTAGVLDTPTPLAARVAADAVALREALRPAAVDAIPSAAPWSTRNGEGAYAGTATVNVGGAVDLECLSAGGQVVAAAGRAPWLLRPGMVFMARLSAFSSVSAADSVAFFVTDNLATQPVYSGLQISGTGVCLARINGGGTAGSQTVAGITAGQGWGILVARGADVDIYVGVGADGEPPADEDWTYIGTVSRGAAANAPWAIVGVQLNRDGGSGDITAQITGLRYRVWL